MIAMHRNHSVDLQECVQAISTKLFEANLEVQKLHRELMAHRAKPIAGLDEECLEIAAAEIKRQWVHTVSSIPVRLFCFLPACRSRVSHEHVGHIFRSRRMLKTLFLNQGS